MLLSSKKLICSSVKKNVFLRRSLSETSSIPYAKEKTGTFFQKQPKLENQYVMDVTLRRYLNKVMPREVITEIEPDLIRFGSRVTEDIYEYGLDCEENPPKLIHHNAWGNRIDKIVTTEGWRKLKEISAEEGLVSIAYDRSKYGEWSRLYQMAKLYLFSVSSSLYSCPIAMTDGAAKTLETIGTEQFSRTFSRLVSRDPKQFWTSGQWMTERQGGSDVGNGTETVAVPQEDGTYKLFGYKWFSSATDSDMALTLARIASPHGEVIKGSKGISMFYLETKDQDGKLNNLQVIRLKNKLGTRQVPTAELLLVGTVAQRVSDEGKGIPSIANMLTITRIHNAISSVASMRRITSLARDYSQVRYAFGKPIGSYPLHSKVLAKMELETRGSTLLVFETARLLGLDDYKKSNETERLLLRLLTPIVKLYTAKKSVATVSEGLEAFGGQGYIEDTGLPRLLRDAQVTPIWEGTTNIMALDVLRAIGKSKGEVMRAFHEDVIRRLESADQRPELKESVMRVKNGALAVEEFLTTYPDRTEVAAREIAFALAEIYIAGLLVSQATAKSGQKEDLIAAQRWCYRDFTLHPKTYSSESIADDVTLLMEGYNE